MMIVLVNVISEFYKEGEVSYKEGEGVIFF